MDFVDMQADTRFMDKQADTSRINCMLVADIPLFVANIPVFNTVCKIN